MIEVEFLSLVKAWKLKPMLLATFYKSQCSETKSYLIALLEHKTKTYLYNSYIVIQ